MAHATPKAKNKYIFHDDRHILHILRRSFAKNGAPCGGVEPTVVVVKERKKPEILLDDGEPICLGSSSASSSTRGVPDFPNSDCRDADRSDWYDDR